MSDASFCQVLRALGKGLKETAAGVQPVRYRRETFQAVADQSPLGKEASAYIKRGDLVPDGVIVKLVAERLKERIARRVLFLMASRGQFHKLKASKRSCRKWDWGCRLFCWYRCPIDH